MHHYGIKPVFITMDYPSGHLPGKLISKEGNISWPPRSPDLW